MKILKDLRKKIEKDWGKQCKDFNIDCCVCQVYLGLTILEQKYDEAGENLFLNKLNKYEK